MKFKKKEKENYIGEFVHIEVIGWNTYVQAIQRRMYKNVKILSLNFLSTGYCYKVIQYDKPSPIGTVTFYIKLDDITSIEIMSDIERMLFKVENDL